MWLSPAAVPQAEGAQGGGGWQWGSGRQCFFFVGAARRAGKGNIKKKLDEDRSGHGQKEVVDGNGGACGRGGGFPRKSLNLYERDKCEKDHQ